MGRSLVANDKSAGERRAGRLTVALALASLLIVVSIQLPIRVHSPPDISVPSESSEQNEKRDLVSPAAPVLAQAVLSGGVKEDVTIGWTLSADDGSGDNDVSHYAVYVSDAYDCEGDGYYFLGQAGSGETSFTHVFAGDGDWANHFYYIQANDTSGNGNWSGQAGKFVRFLEKGKQLASVPLVQDDTTLEVVLQTLEGSFKHVRYYKSSDQSDHWKSYWTFKTYRTLFHIDHRMGFWIDMTQDDHLVVAGLVPEMTQIELGHNWNLVGYPSFIDRTVSEALAGIQWTKVQGWGSTPPHHQRQMSGSDIMTAGEAYWIWVDMPQVWEVYNKPLNPPYIVWTDPANGQVDIPLRECIIITFSEPMDPSSVTVIVTPPTPIVVTWLNSTVLQICPADAWNDCTFYTVQVTGQSMDGENLVPGPVPNPWTLITNCCVCYILSTDPCDGEVGVQLDRPITIVFSDEMNPTTLVYSLNPDPGGLTVTWLMGNTVLVLTHNDFMPGTTYELHVVYVEDVNGVPLAPGPLPNPFSFSTGMNMNPYILMTDPYDGEIEVSVDRDLSVRFSKPMNTSSVSWMMSPAMVFSTNWSENDTLVVLTHTMPFAECTQYAFEVMSALDKSGNPLVPGPVPNPWSFITVSLCPYVVLTDPADNETNVSLWQDIWIEFSWSMNWSSMNWSIDPDPGGWNLVWPGDVAMYFAHTNPFQTNTTYVFQITYIEDVYGVPLCELPFTFSFTTGS